MLTSNNSSTTNSSLAGTDTNNVSFDNLYPAIVQCFFIILVGYIAGRINILSSTQGKGIGTFVSTFCLPALLFKSMCLLNFETVNWMFLLSILIAKTVVFVLVVIITLLAKRPLNFGYAGIFAIFVTQSNDFALGYPILEALYHKSHPEYLEYIYLVAPISIMFLNPVGFAMLEIQKRKSHSANTSRCKMAYHVLKGVVSNPLVFMTFIGIIGNFVFQRNIPVVLLDILTVLGDAFNATALFYLGLSLVGKVQKQSGVQLVVPLLLIGVKTLLLPLITWQIVGTLDSEEDNINDTMSMSMYGFLYGTFPTAPSVFLYASHYSIAMDTVATGMVAGTLLSAPIMFVSARMMTMGVNDEMDYKSLLLETSVSTSIISVVCCVWLLFVLVFSRKCKKMPHQFLILFVISHMLACIGTIAADGAESLQSWTHYVTFSMISVGVLAARCLTAVISVSLYLIHSCSLCVLLRLKWWMFSLAFGLPVIGAGVLYFTGCEGIQNEVDPSFLYGQCQSSMWVVVLTFSSVVNIICLVLRQRCHTDDSTYLYLPKNESLEDSFVMRRQKANKSKWKGDQSPLLYESTDDVSDISEQYRSVNNCKEGQLDSGGPFPDDICSVSSSSDSSENNKMDNRTNIHSEEQTIDIICRSRLCTNKQRPKCEKLLNSYFSGIKDKYFEVQVEGQSVPNTGNMFQSDKFIILLASLQISVCISLFLSIWRLFNSQISGIYVEIEFLDCVLNYGQGFLVFALFGFDTKTVLLPFVKRFRRLIYGAEVIRLPSREDIDEDVVHLCHQFVKYHMQKCKQYIVKDKKYRFREYKQVFTGTEMCDWLIEVGLANDRGEAIKYGKSLLTGQVIKHVASEHNFYDLPYFYIFSENISLTYEP